MKMSNREKLIIIYILIISFFAPNIFGILDSLFFIDIIFYYWRLVSIIIILSFVLYKYVLKKYKPNSIIILSVLLYVVFTISTLLLNGDLLYLAKNASQTLTLLLFIDLCIKTDKVMIIKALKNILFILVLANLFSLILYPNLEITDNSSWVLGSKNNHIFTIIPLIITSLSWDYIKLNKISGFTMLSFFMGVLTVFLNNSTTGILIMIIYTLLFIIHRIFKLPKVSIKYFFIISLIFSVVFVTNLGKIVLEPLITYLDKSETFGRFDVWDNAILFIKNRLIIGYGFEYESIVLSKILYGHAHNRYLDMLYVGGIIGLLIFLIIIFKVIGELIKSKNKFYIYFSIILTGYFISFMTESRRLDYEFYISIIILYDIASTTKYIGTE